MNDKDYLRPSLAVRCIKEQAAEIKRLESEAKEFNESLIELKKLNSAAAFEGAAKWMERDGHLLSTVSTFRKWAKSVTESGERGS